ncbi:MAG: DUF4126 domain-containing protein [Chthoniobacterales bacterium]
MNSLHLLGIAFGLAMLSGLNLYLTVFASGLAIRMHWITLSGDFQQLAFLGDDWILGISGVFFALEFFADKIPWVDTFWDTLHTVIRPLGGALLATRVLGDASPTFLVIVGLMAGTMSFATHSAKAGTRIIANGSPEPFTNIGLSLGEDFAVLGGLALLHFNPILALVVFLLVLMTTLYFAPKLFRAVKAKLWLAYRKLNLPAFGRAEEGLSDELSGRVAEGFAELNLLHEKVLWSVPCLTRKGLPANHFGALIATVEEPGRLYFVGESRWKKVRETLELDGGTVERIPGFLFDEIRLADAVNKRRYAFAFDRSRSRIVEKMADSIRNRLAPISMEVE